MLSEDLAAFLDQALIIKGGGSLFFYVYGLVSPTRLWQTFEGITPDEESPRYLTLYGAHSMASHPDGLAFDMKTNKAIMQMSIHDTAITLTGRMPWYPLEVVLSAWLDMVDAGKVKAVDYEVEFNPWICLHWNDSQVGETVTAFNRLVESIESRMRGQGLPVPSEASPLLPESSLDAEKIPLGFAWSFLSKARRPPFRHIAPGLCLPDQDSFLEQPFTSEDEDNEEEGDDSDEEDELQIKPILLFRSSQIFHQPDDEDSDTNPFNYPYDQIHSFPAGLYLTESERMTDHGFEDSIRLVLPSPIGSNGFARTSDSLQIGDKQISQTSSFGLKHADLYQAGWRPFTEMHDARLVEVLDSWRGMVERGDWDVGAEGIKGSIEAFKEADIEEGWDKFVIPVSW